MFSHRRIPGALVAIGLSLLFVLTVSAVDKLPAQEARLQSGETTARNMFELYERNRKEGVPSYVTEDFLLLGYLMLFDETFQEVEKTTLAPAFESLVARLGTKLANVDLDDDAAEVVRANRQFVAVLQILLDPTTETNDTQAEDPVVTTEVEKIFAAGGVERSAVVVQPIDYSQLKPRGRYAANADLSRYFRAVRYAGAVLFPVLPSRATGISEDDANRLTAQALQLTALLDDDGHLDDGHFDDGHSVDETLTYWLGPSQNLVDDDYRDVAAKGKRKIARVRKTLLERARREGRQPLILSRPVVLDQLAPGTTAADVLTGWSLFPARSTAASAAFQELVSDRVGSYVGDIDFKNGHRPRTLSLSGGVGVKSFPSPVELMALLGSDDAAANLDATGDRDYARYNEAAERARTRLDAATGLPARHLELLAHWLAPGAERPAGARRVNTALAFWTYERHAVQLYAKQSYTGVTKGFSKAPPRHDAYLEPAAELYEEILASARDMQAGQVEDSRIPWQGFAEMMERCLDVAWRERAGEALDEADVKFLNNLDVTLFKLVSRRDAPIIVDVHTDGASGEVLQTGLGWPRAVTKDLGDADARGALFQYSELRQGAGERLTDEAWRRQLAETFDPSSTESSAGDER